MASDESRGAAFFAATRARFADAARTGTSEHHFEIAGERLHLRCAGPELATALGRALAPLRVPPHATSALLLQAWDAAATGVGAPHPRLRAMEFGAMGEARPYCDAEFETLFLASGTLTILDRRRHEALLCARDARAWAGHEQAAPARGLLAGWLSSRDHHLVHAAAVGTAHGAALLVGSGGAGKSNTALACLEAGMLYLGDDYCAVSAGPPPRAHAVYASAKLERRDVAHFPGLETARGTAAGPEEKVVLFPGDVRPERIARTLPLKVVVLPRLGNGTDSRARPVAASAALLPLATSTTAQAYGHDTTLFSALAATIRRLPCYELLLGSDRSRVAATLASLIEQ